MEKQVSEIRRVPAVIKAIKVHNLGSEKEPKIGYTFVFMSEEGKKFTSSWIIKGVNEKFAQSNVNQISWLIRLILIEGTNVDENIGLEQVINLVGKKVNLIIFSKDGKKDVFAIGKENDFLYMAVSKFFHQLGMKAPEQYLKREEETDQVSIVYNLWRKKVMEKGKQ